MHTDASSQPNALPSMTAPHLPSIRPLLVPSPDERTTPSTGSSSNPTPPMTGQASARADHQRLPSFSAIASESSSSYHHPQHSSSYASGSSSSSSHYPPPPLNSYPSSRPYPLSSSSTHSLYPPHFSGHPSAHQPPPHELDAFGSDGRRSPARSRNTWPDPHSQHRQYAHRHQQQQHLADGRPDSRGATSWGERNDEAESPRRRTTAEHPGGASKSQAAFVVKLYQ